MAGGAVALVAGRRVALAARVAVRAAGAVGAGQPGGSAGTGSIWHGSKPGSNEGVAALAVGEGAAVVSTIYLTGATSMDVKDHQLIVYALSPRRCSPVIRLL